jgi:DNA-binding response OmpR family regulator
MQDDDDGAAPPHLLVVERDMIVGFALAEDLGELGYKVSGPYRSFAEVATLLADEPPDGAIIDIAITDGAGIEATRALCRRGIPVVFFSAGDRRRTLDAEFKDVPWVDRPAATERLLGALGIRRR